MLQERNHDFRDRLPNFDQTTSCKNRLPVKWRMTTTDLHGSIPTGATAFSSSNSTIPIASWRTPHAKYVEVEPISPPRQFLCAEDHVSVSTVSECDESSETGDTCDVHADAHPAEIDRLLVIRFFFQDSRFEATCGNIDHQHRGRLSDLLERRISRMYQPVSFWAAGPFGRMLAWLRKSEGHGDVSCWSDHTNPSLLAMFYHAERQHRAKRPSELEGPVEVSWPRMRTKHIICVQCMMAEQRTRKNATRVPARPEARSSISWHDVVLTV